MAEAKLVALVEANTKQLENALKRVERLAGASFKSMEQSSKRLDTSMRSVSGNVNTLTTRMSAGFTGVRNALLAIQGAFFVREILDYADAWTVAGNQIKAAAQISGQAVVSLKQVNDIATETRSSFEATSQLYARLVRSTGELNLSQKELASLTKTVNEAFVAGGAVTSERIAGILQLGQALSSGFLQGDELRSIRETAPLIAQALADEFKTTIGGLKQIGAEGRITTEKIVSAITKAGPAIHAAFGTTIPTVADSVTLLNNAFIELVGTLNQEGNITGTLVPFLINTAKWVRENKEQVSDYDKTINLLLNTIKGYVAQGADAAKVDITKRLDKNRIATLTAEIEKLRDRIAAARQELGRPLPTPGGPLTNPMVSAVPVPDTVDRASVLAKTQEDMERLHKDQVELEKIKRQTVDRARADAVEARENLYAERDITEDFTASTENIETSSNHIHSAAEELAGSADKFAKQMEVAMSKQGDFATSVAQVPEQFREAIVKAANEWDVPANLVASVLHAESGFAPDVISGQRKSSTGATGIAQFMPETAAAYGVNPYDPESSIRGAAHLLHDLIVQFNGDVEAAVAAYNAGPGTVTDYLAGKRKLPAETQAYVPKVMKGLPTFGEQLSTDEKTAADAASAAEDAAKKKQDIKDATDALEVSVRREIEALGLEAKAFGMSSYEAEKAKVFQDLLNQSQDAGIAITAEYRAHLEDLAGQQASATIGVQTATAANEKLKTAQQDQIAQMDELRSFSSGVLSGFISDLVHGKSASEALAGALGKIADKLIDMASNNIIAALFGKAGAIGGGIFGGSTGTIADPLAGVPLTQGGFFAKGGVMTSRGPVPLRRYASGGVASTPQMAMFGEGSRPEAYVPLPDGRRIPVNLRAPRMSGPPGGRQRVDVDSRIHIAPSDQFDVRVESRVRQAQAETFRAMPAYLGDQQARAAGSAR